MSDHFGTPDTTVNCEKIFGFQWDVKIPAFSQASEFVPLRDESYSFDPATTKAILAGFIYNRRVLVQGFHGTGKSSHIEQVAARLNWPCVRVNLDGHVTRMDLIGRDMISLEDGKQVTSFREGILPWAFTRGAALIFDEYDAGRPDVLFVIQRVLEQEGKLTLLDINKVLLPHPSFRLFATANTVGLGDTTGLYHGTNPLNQGQMDRWNIVTKLNYLEPEREAAMIVKKLPAFQNPQGEKTLAQMVAMASLTRSGFMNGDLSNVMSPRTVFSWAQNVEIFGDIKMSFQLTFAHKCDELEQPILDEYYQRCFG